MNRLARVGCQSNPFVRVMIHRGIGSVTQNEQYFTKLKDQWWAPQGELEILSRMNNLRVPFIAGALQECQKREADRGPQDILKGNKIIDVGCGGGLLTEPLARLGAHVTGLDIVASNIEAARAHADKDPEISERITYVHGRIEEVEEQFDALVASEVVEHVEYLDSFITHCARVIKPRGHLFFTTINRTFLSLLIAKIAAEYIVNLVPRGVHDWRLFVTPDELQLKLAKNGCSVASTKGMMYNPIGGYWIWVDMEAVNYALHAVKTS
ncbi:hexaprenyldihydroxybenzoate methyltransferase [Tropilaelaps mercedesae]|uniref:Ubiquinone biosynthesis O-methyltransferase, mitochondrial n=1 Tax=Tropilaelaps mercedesae TaxID=418985 RepID=A0A1V9XVJ8_9ACAR|nr:hexaprenyldihydroxybenzoate methyltransferase [Tropilaelaps mercedesae]